MKNANYYIQKLGLIKHPEGGYFKEVYRCDELLEKERLPQRYNGDRNMSTSIYYLLENDDFSSFHKLKSDEIWHFYKGTSVMIYVIDEHGILTENILGDDLDKNEHLQFTIKKGTWFAARIIQPHSFVLIGCTVAPGFNFADFEMGKRSDLLKWFPEYKNIIERLTVNGN